MKVADHFHKESEGDTESGEDIIVCNKMHFNPKQGRNDSFNTIRDTITNLPLNSYIKKR